MGIFMTAMAYLAVASFAGRILWRILLLTRAREVPTDGPGASTPKLILKGAADILLLRRLFRDNGALWAGEWLFHISFILIVLGHMRFFFNPVPEFFNTFRIMGYAAGYVFLFAVLYILVFRVAIERGAYISQRNFILVLIAFFIGASGMYMHLIDRIDLVMVKEFGLGIVSFSPQAAPHGGIFVIHFILAMLFILLIPSHVFTAPFVVTDARRREEMLRKVMHGEE